MTITKRQINKLEYYIDDFFFIRQWKEQRKENIKGKSRDIYRADSEEQTSL